MKVQINNKQFFFITVIYILANDITRGIFIKELVNDIWIPNLIGLAGSLLFFSLYMFIYRNNKFDNFENSIKNYFI